MLKQKTYKIGKQILTVTNLKDAPSTLFLSYKNNKGDCFCIDNPVNNQFSRGGEDDDMIQFWLDKNLQLYDIYERIVEDRRPVFSKEIDQILDDMLSEFAYNYTDSENYQEEFMEDLLEELKYIFNITLIDKKEIS